MPDFKPLSCVRTSVPAAPAVTRALSIALQALERGTEPWLPSLPDRVSPLWTARCRRNSSQ
eukprot:5059442-Prymnesium_polylepis.1